MTRRVVALVTLAGFCVVGVGCSDQNLAGEIETVRAQTKREVDLLKKRNELLNRRLNEMNEELQDLLDSNDRLSGELAEYVNRPEEVKLEIITEVNSRFQRVATDQETFKNELNGVFATRTQNISADLDSGLVDLAKSLEQHTTFAQFVATEQDSINRVFANRFDSRPWYQSILGKWEDLERERDMQE